MDALTESAAKQAWFTNHMLELAGYHTCTTFYGDFSIADPYGKSSIEDTYERAFKSWKDNLKYITELVMVLNHKCWEHYYAENHTLSELYQHLYEKTHDWCLDHLKGKDLTYYLQTLD